MTKLKNTKCDKIQKLQLGQNSETQTVRKLKKSNCDGSTLVIMTVVIVTVVLVTVLIVTVVTVVIVTEVTVVIVTVVIVTVVIFKSFSTNNLIPQHPCDVFRAVDVIFQCGNHQSNP